jgi:predicted GIY-YIG superfamily endonuclease
MKFYYVYILVSEKAPNHFYAGFTENANERVGCHL